MSERKAHYNVRDRGDHLTAREVTVLALVAEGWRNKPIAGRLGITVKTVESHMRHLRRKVLGDHFDDGKVVRVALAVRYWRWVREATE